MGLAEHAVPGDLWAEGGVQGPLWRRVWRWASAGRRDRLGVVLTCWPRGRSELLGAGTEGAGERATRESAPRAAPARVCAPRSARRACSLRACGRGQPGLCVPAPRCVRVAHGDRAAPKPPPVAAGNQSEAPLVCCRPPSAARPALSCGRGAASAAQPGPGPREATDHRLPGGPRRRGVGCRPMSARGRG